MPDRPKSNLEVVVDALTGALSQLEFAYHHADLDGRRLKTIAEMAIAKDNLERALHQYKMDLDVLVQQEQRDLAARLGARD